MEIRRAWLDELEIPLVEPFETSFGTERKRRFLIVRLEDRNGEAGFGECVAADAPLYSSESVTTARWMLSRYLLPSLVRTVDTGPAKFRTSAQSFRGHPMAKASVEMALWDLHAKQRHRSLAHELGGVRARVAVGVSVGIQPSIPALVRRVGRFLEDGYRRVKLKVRPGWDEAPVRAVRREYPGLRLWVDANQGYRPAAGPAIRRWATRWGVEQVEQPFADRELRAHTRLQRGARFRVCLDESIVDAPSLEEALTLRALRSLNVKPGRVGGLAAGGELAQRARRAGVPAWVGGMLESGIGRAHNLALASLGVFALPGDISASRRYYREDIVDPPFELGPRSTLAVPRGPGIGVVPAERAYRKFLRRRRVFRRKTP